MKKENYIVVNGVKYNFIQEKNEDREVCQICSLKENCFTRLKPENMICNIHKDRKQGVLNGYYDLDN